KPFRILHNALGDHDKTTGKLCKFHNDADSSSVSTKTLRLRWVYESAGNCRHRILHNVPKLRTNLYVRYAEKSPSRIRLFAVLSSGSFPVFFSKQHLLEAKVAILAQLFLRK